MQNGRKREGHLLKKEREAPGELHIGQSIRKDTGLQKYEKGLATGFVAKRDLSKFHIVLFKRFALYLRTQL
jgi:hypothetical protein